MSTPQDHARVAQLLVGQSAVRFVRVVDDAVIERQAELLHRCIPTEVLIGEEEDLRCAIECPTQCTLCIRRRADGAMVAPRERFDRGGGIHVRDRRDVVGNTE